MKHHATETYENSGIITSPYLTSVLLGKLASIFTPRPHFVLNKIPPYSLDRRMDESQIQSLNCGNGKEEKLSPSFLCTM
jgi:hypothetical protein